MRDGEFQELATTAYSVSAAAVRIETLAFALDELKRRARAGAAPYGRVDPSTIVLAGFDLGAQTATLVAGGSLPQRQPKASVPGVRAVIILSPSSRRNDAADQARFAALTLPTLSITGTEDVDPFGLVSEPALRQEPWNLMPPGEKYLLVLAGGNHAMLAGNGLFDSNSRQSAGAGDRGRVTSNGQRGGRGRRSCARVARHKRPCAGLARRRCSS